VTVSAIARSGSFLAKIPILLISSTIPVQVLIIDSIQVSGSVADSNSNVTVTIVAAVDHDQSRRCVVVLWPRGSFLFNSRSIGRGTVLNA
jgi:hypothetical protein